MHSIYSLLYVSEASNGFEPDPSIDAIVKSSIAWNDSVGVTGVLIYSGGYFTQYLEGLQGDVELIFQRIRSDPQHHSLNIVNTYIRSERFFPEWSLAYAGDASFVHEEITRLFAASQAEPVEKSAAMRMIELMRDFMTMRRRLDSTLH